MKQEAIVVPGVTGANTLLALDPDTEERYFIPLGFPEVKALKNGDVVYVQIEKNPCIGIPGLTKAKVTKVKPGIQEGSIEVQFLAGSFSGYHMVPFWDQPRFFIPRNDEEVEAFTSGLCAENVEKPFPERLFGS